MMDANAIFNGGLCVLAALIFFIGLWRLQEGA